MEVTERKLKDLLLIEGIRATQITATNDTTACHTRHKRQPN